MRPPLRVNICKSASSLPFVYFDRIYQRALCAAAHSALSFSIPWPSIELPVNPLSPNDIDKGFGVGLTYLTDQALAFSHADHRIDHDAGLPIVQANPLDQSSGMVGILYLGTHAPHRFPSRDDKQGGPAAVRVQKTDGLSACLLYTSDAADD